jgi:hypothetical protein
MVKVNSQACFGNSEWEFKISLPEVSVRVYMPMERHKGSRYSMSLFPHVETGSYERRLRTHKHSENEGSALRELSALIILDTQVKHILSSSIKSTLVYRVTGLGGGTYF